MTTTTTDAEVQGLALLEQRAALEPWDDDERVRLTVAGVLELPDAFAVCPIAATEAQGPLGVEWGGRRYEVLG